MNDKTNWLGLWNNREGVYSGQVIKKADIPPYARLVVRYNKFYEKDSNRPRFVYCFASGDSAKAITVKKTHEEFIDMQNSPYEEDGCYYTCDGERLYTESEVQAMINRCACYVGGDSEYGEHLVSDYNY